MARNVLTDWRRTLFNEDKHRSMQLGMQIGEEQHAMDNIMKDSVDEKLSISDARQMTRE
jgi:hypothetical protein